MIEWGKVDPDQLEQTFRRAVEQRLKDSPHRWLVTSGYRSLEEQERLHGIYLAGGPLAAPPGRSAHNYGLAIDVVPDGNPMQAGWQLDWQPSPGDGWYWLAGVIDAHPILRHGRHFADWPHIQRVNWAAHKGQRASDLARAQHHT